MKRILLLCLTMSCAAGVSAQGFYSVHSPNGTDVWAVGNGGMVFHSFDGGAIWTQTSQGTAALRGVFSLGNAVWMVSDNGKCFLSSDGGTSFAEETPAGTTSFSSITFIDAQTGFIAGVNGTILKTTDGGISWSPQTSGTAQKISTLFFVDVQTGFAGGTNGTLLKTVNGGATWTSIAGAGWLKDITNIAVSGSTVYVTGVDAFCVKSVTGGSSWTALNFATDTKSDVNGVFAKTDSEVFFVGGGGYIRRTMNGGGSFEWPHHGLHATLNDIFFYNGQTGWACSQKNNAVLRTTDGGTTWLLPTGTTMNASWTQKLSVTATVRGNAFSINPVDKNILYSALGNRVYASYNRGETWANISGITGTKVSSFYVSPKDSNLWVAAVGTPDQIVRSTNHGATWTSTMVANFTEYGMPLEMDGSHPDTLLFGPEDGKLYRSLDFGATWAELSAPGFRSPCDIVVARDNPDVIWVGDGVTGSGLGVMHRSDDAGRSFRIIYTTTGSEIPTTVGSSLNNKVGYATAWGSGGVVKTVDMALSWNSVATTGSTWGVDISKDDPNVVMFGVYGGATSYLSSSAGAAFFTSPLSGSNYAIYAYDRGTFLAQQSGGIFKYNINYTVPVSTQQTLALSAPNGGENWSYGSVREIVWNGTNIANVKLDYKTAPASPWQTIVASAPAGVGRYAWTIPNAVSNQARVRVSDALDTNPIDSSDGVFSITLASIAANPTSVNFGSVIVGTSHSQTVLLTNSGTGTLVVTSVISSNASFVAGRSSFTIPAGQSDTLSVLFTPNDTLTFAEHLQINCNVPGSPLDIPVVGIGTSSVAVAVTAPNGGEVWRAGTIHNITWSAIGIDRVEISYKTSSTGSWQRIIQSIAASTGNFEWTVPNTPTTQARVRIIERASGSVVDTSDATFTIDGASSVAELGGIPNTYELNQNYPNPFNPSTVITYGVPATGFVSLKIFNMIGQEIATLVSERLAAGRYSVTFDTQKLAGNVSSGLYFYRMNAGDYTEIKKMMLVK